MVLDGGSEGIGAFVSREGIPLKHQDRRENNGGVPYDVNQRKTSRIVCVLACAELASVPGRRRKGHPDKSKEGKNKWLRGMLAVFSRPPAEGSIPF